MKQAFEHTITSRACSSPGLLIRIPALAAGLPGDQAVGHGGHSHAHDAIAFRVTALLDVPEAVGRP